MALALHSASSLNPKLFTATSALIGADKDKFHESYGGWSPGRGRGVKTSTDFIQCQMQWELSKSAVQNRCSLLLQRDGIIRQSLAGR